MSTDTPRPERVTIHAAPPIGSGLMPCCGRTPLEVPADGRMSMDPTAVTCAGREHGRCPERVTLTDVHDLYVTDSGECCSDHCVADVHDLRLDQAERLVEVLAAREQALREEIAGEIERKSEQLNAAEDYGRGGRDGLKAAARIARGGAR